MAATPTARWVPWITRRLPDDVFAYIGGQGVSAGKTLGKLLRPELVAGRFVVESYVPSDVSEEWLRRYEGGITRRDGPPRFGPSPKGWIIARLSVILGDATATLVVPDPMSNGTESDLQGPQFHDQLGVEAVRFDDGDYYVLRPGDTAPERIHHTLESASNAWMTTGVVTTATVPTGRLTADALQSIATGATHLIQTVYDGESWLLATRP